MLLGIHQSLIAPQFDLNATASTSYSPTIKKPAPSVEGCAFLREKLERQIEENRGKKGKAKIVSSKTKSATVGKVFEDKGDEVRRSIFNVII